jgi:signal transduction histidine kinase
LRSACKANTTFKGWSGPELTCETKRRESPAYRRLIASAEAAEFRGGRPETAATLYGQAAALADNDAERGEATLREARVLARQGRTSAALVRYRAVAALPSSVRDSDGMPLALYASQALLAIGGEFVDTARLALRRLLGGLSSIDAPAVLALRELADTAGIEVGDRIEQRLELIDQVRQLEKSLPGLITLRAGRGVRIGWMAFGPAPWLVSVVPTRTTTDSAVIVVRPAVLLAALSREGGPVAPVVSAVRLTSTPEPGAETLDESLAGLHVVFTDNAMLASGDSSLGARVFVVVLPIVATLTLLVGWLFWRDVRREVAAAELRSQFVSGVSHELKTPLTSIRMFAETLLLGRPADAEGRREYLETIVQESERLTRLINNVLDFARIERGEQHYRFAPTELSGVVRDSARAVAYQLRQSGFELALSVPGDLLSISADRDALMQAVLNLLSNAMKYSGNSRTIELSLLQRNGDALIQVCDRGVGIAWKDHRRIFDRYYRSPESESSSIPGTGLGLSLVAHVAKAHGGSVDVDSTPGGGSTFTVRLPLERNT